MFGLIRKKWLAYGRYLNERTPKGRGGRDDGFTGFATRDAEEERRRTTAPGSGGRVPGDLWSED